MPPGWTAAARTAGVGMLGRQPPASAPLPICASAEAEVSSELRCGFWLLCLGAWAGVRAAPRGGAALTPRRPP